jgi:hypothetical protein
MTNGQPPQLSHTPIVAPDGLHWKVHAENMKRVYGYTPYTGKAPRCIRTLMGKRCQAHRGRNSCICERYHVLLDHKRAWRNVYGERVMTAEPYQIESEQLIQFESEVRGLHLALQVGGYSPWYPGNTHLIRIALCFSDEDKAAGIGVGPQPTQKPVTNPQLTAAIIRQGPFIYRRKEQR